MRKGNMWLVRTVRYLLFRYLLFRYLTHSKDTVSVSPNVKILLEYDINGLQWQEGHRAVK